MRMSSRAGIALIVGLWCSTALAQMGMRRLRSQPVNLPVLPPDVAATQADPAFPLKAHLFVARWNGYGSEYHGYGTGNLTEGPLTHGFDYTFSCSVPFQRSMDPAANFQARWKRPGYQLEILLARVGEEREDVCTLKVVVRQTATDPAQLRMAANGAAPQPANQRWQAPDVAFDEPDPDYPVQLHVISATQRNDMAASQGWGSANLFGQPVRGADFSFTCDYGLLPNATATGFYQGHWVKPDQELELLTQRAGSDKVDKCRIKLTVRDTAYLDRQPNAPSANQPVMERRDRPGGSPPPVPPTAR